jgi:Ca2+-binding RTX toxin-like protein
VSLSAGIGDDFVSSSRKGDADTIVEVFAASGDDVVFTVEHDVVHGGSGNDTLINQPPSQGVAGGTELDGGPGADMLNGGWSVVTYFGSASAVSVTLDGVANDGVAGEGDNVGARVAKVIGGAGADLLDLRGGTSDFVWASGGYGDDRIFVDEDGSYLEGGSGDDFIVGGPGADEVHSGSGVDMLFGGSGNDALYGGDDIDYLYGGDGNDQLHGQDGDDFLDANAGANSLYGGTGNDTCVVDPEPVYREGCNVLVK